MDEKVQAETKTLTENLRAFDAMNKDLEKRLKDAKKTDDRDSMKPIKRPHDSTHSAALQRTATRSTIHNVQAQRPCSSIPPFPVIKP